MNYISKTKVWKLIFFCVTLKCFGVNGVKENLYKYQILSKYMKSKTQRQSKENLLLTLFWRGLKSEALGL